MSKNFKRGFTLVELSIVLIILGLLVGGIVGGSKLIEVAKVNAVISEIRGYNTSINIFRASYNNALPGDIATPTDIGTGISGAGNGDSKITCGSGVAAGTNNEAQNAWYHLSVAGLITTTVTTSATAANTDVAIGTIVPGSKIPSAGYSFFSATTGSTLAYLFPNATSLVFGGVGSAALTGTDNSATVICGKVTNAEIIPTSIAISVDKKYDDGVVTSGYIKSLDTGTDGTSVMGIKLDI